MCGIAGFVGSPDHKLLIQMSERIAHRGPDDDGSLEGGFASIAHRRLAVIDPDHGHQPMSNPDGTVHIVYNGEVHNFRQLRAELESEGYEFSTRCDTEVVLRAYEAWGSACFRRFNGMWAMAILDEREVGKPRVVLCRDHLGVKPIYLAEAGNRLLFASEIKSLLACPELEVAVDEERLSCYLLTGLHNHDTGTFFAGVRQVPPATALTLTLEAGSRRERAERYWQPRLSSGGPSDPARFREALTAAVERRLISDLTVGTCLSGGLDSSTIVSLMSELLGSGAADAASMGERLKTFSAVFPGDPIDERRYIEPVLERSQAESYYIEPRSDQLFEDLPLVVWHQDEPMVSSGPYAQYRVMAFARDHARVLLDGQGGDELLAGYVPHLLVYVRQLLSERRYLHAAREAAAAADILGPLVLRKLMDRRKAVRPSALCTERVRRHLPAARAADHRTNRNLKERLLQDLTTYSLPPMLRYEDRNAMAYAIESRPPFLDQELVELILSLPAEAIVRHGWSRAILRQAMKGVLPEPVRRRRKKIGFTTPEMRWFRAERAAVRGILHSPAFQARPYWDGAAVVSAFEACYEGRLEESLFFWRVLDAEAWLRVFHGPMPLSERGGRPAGTLAEAGDALVPDLLGDADRERAGVLLELASPHPRRHLFTCDASGRSVYARVPLSSWNSNAPETFDWASLAGRVAPRDTVVALGTGREPEEARAAAQLSGLATALASRASDLAGGPVDAVVLAGRDEPHLVAGEAALGASELAFVLADEPFGRPTAGTFAVGVVRPAGSLA